MERALGRKIKIAIITDSESLLNVVVKSSVTSEKRLTVDTKAAREAFDRREIRNIGWVKSRENLADRLTKRARCTAQEQFLDTGRMKMTIEQWVIRMGVSTTGMSSRNE